MKLIRFNTEEPNPNTGPYQWYKRHYIRTRYNSFSDAKSALEMFQVVFELFKIKPEDLLITITAGISNRTVCHFLLRNVSEERLVFKEWNDRI